MPTRIKMVSMFTNFFLGSLFTAVAWVNMFIVLEIVMLVLVEMTFRHFDNHHCITTTRLTHTRFSQGLPLVHSRPYEQWLTSAAQSTAAHAQTICFVVHGRLVDTLFTCYRRISLRVFFFVFHDPVSYFRGRNNVVTKVSPSFPFLLMALSLSGNQGWPKKCERPRQANNLAPFYNRYSFKLCRPSTGLANRYIGER